MYKFLQVQTLDATLARLDKVWVKTCVQTFVDHAGNFHCAAEDADELQFNVVHSHNKLPCASVTAFVTYFRLKMTTSHDKHYDTDDQYIPSIYSQNDAYDVT